MQNVRSTNNQPPVISVKGYTLLNAGEAIEITGDTIAAFITNANQPWRDQFKVAGREWAKALLREKLLNAIISPAEYDNPQATTNELVSLFPTRQVLRFVYDFTIDTAFNSIEKLFNSDKPAHE